MSSPSTEISPLRKVSKRKNSEAQNEVSPKMKRNGDMKNYVKPASNSGSYKNHICQSCHKDFSRNKWSQANFEKHGDRCSRLIKFIHNGITCKICQKTCGKTIYRHLETKHALEINDNGVHDEKIEQKPKIKEEKQEIVVKKEPLEKDDFSPKVNKSNLRIEFGSENKCEICNTSVKKANMGRHRKNCETKHKFVENLKCTFCGKGFANQSVAYQHLSKIHFEELQNANEKENEDSGQFSGIEEDKEEKNEGKLSDRIVWKNEKFTLTVETFRVKSILY